MATAAQPTLFNQAVSKILSSWTALRIAVEHGCGGSNSKQKAQNLVNDIEVVFNRKNKLDPSDFADFLEDEVDTRFDLILEDGSVQMIANHICQCFTRLKEGRITEVEQFLKGLPNSRECFVQFAGGENSSDEDDEDEDMENSVSQPQQLQQQSQSSNNGGRTSSELPTTNGSGDAAMDVEEEEDGWTIVRKGGRKR